MLGIEVYRVTRNTRTYLSYFILPPAYSRQDYKHSISIPPDRSFKYASVGQRDFIKFSIKWNNGERVWDFFQISLSLSFFFLFFLAKFCCPVKNYRSLLNANDESRSNKKYQESRIRRWSVFVYPSLSKRTFVQAFSDLPRCVDCYSKCNAVNAFDPCRILAILGICEAE